jgi:hypothetical protein
VTTLILTISHFTLRVLPPTFPPSTFLTAYSYIVTVSSSVSSNSPCCQQLRFLPQSHGQQFCLLPPIVPRLTVLPVPPTAPRSTVLPASSYSPNVNSSDCFLLQPHRQQFCLVPPIVQMSTVLPASSYSPNVNSSDCFLLQPHRQHSDCFLLQSYRQQF